MNLLKQMGSSVDSKDFQDLIRKMDQSVPIKLQNQEGQKINDFMAQGYQTQTFGQLDNEDKETNESARRNDPMNQTQTKRKSIMKMLD